ncbi:MAG: ATP-binding protein, partial [Vulcanimicrobiaceae bacterium]
EAAYRMPSLAIPDPNEAVPLSADDALAYGAISLFAERAQAADASFVITDENAPVVADICRRLDGMAFAIELAAARLTILKPQELRTRLDQRFRVLTGGSRDALPRQQTLRALIDWSHDLLDEREQTVFRRIGIFVGGFTLEGATAVVGDELDELDVMDVLASLADKSLIVAEKSGDETRYHLLESTHAYALEKILAAGERADLGARHFAYLKNLFERTAATYERTPRDVTVRALATELDDMRAALDWAEGNDPSGGADLLTATILLPQLDLHRESIERAKRFAAAVDGTDARRLARLWIHVSACETGRYAHNRALAAARQGIAFARESGDRATLADALMKLARAAGFEHELDECSDALREVEGPDLTPRQQLEFLRSRASTAGFFGDLALSSQIYEQMQALHRSLGNERGEYTAAANLAENAYGSGDAERAIVSAREALVVAERCKDRNAIALLNQNLAGYSLAVDDVAGSRSAGEAVLRYYERVEPANPHVPVTLEHMALVHALEGDRERAARLEGYVNRALLDVGYGREYTECVTQQRLDALLRERYDETELDALLAAGAALTPEEAIAECLR